MKPPFIEGPETPSTDLSPAAEPIVTIMESRDKAFPVGKRMTLSEANEYVRQMDASRHEANAAPQTVKVKIDYMWGDNSDRYWLPLEIGSGRGGLLEQMEERLGNFRSNPDRIVQELDFSRVDEKYRENFQAAFLPFVQKNIDDLSCNLLPYFRNHCSITDLKQAMEALIPGMGESRQKEFRKSLEERVAGLRQQINSLELKQAPQQVQIRQNTPQQVTPDAPPQSRESVKVRLERIKAGQTGQAKGSNRESMFPAVQGRNKLLGNASHGETHFYIK